MKLLQLSEIVMVLDDINADETLSNPEFDDQVAKFYVQLERQPIQFSAWGIYTINYSLLASVSRVID
jgi:7tm Chemosensory receptor